MKVAKLRLRAIGRYPYGRSFQHDRRRKWQWYLELVPTLQLDFVFHRNVKAKNCRSGFPREEHRSLLRDVFRTAWSVDRESTVAALPDFARHFGQSPDSAARTGAACRPISKPADALRDYIAIAVQAGHHNNAAMTPVVRCGKYPSMPERKNRAMAGFVDVVQVGVAFRSPSYRRADSPNRYVSDPSD